MYNLNWRLIGNFILLLLIISYIKSVSRVRSAVLIQQPLVSAVEECRQETGATEAEFQGILKKTKPLSMTAKCMRACLMKRFSLMDENGKFNREVALQIVQLFVGMDAEKMHIATEIVDACYTMAVSENHCEAAEQYGKCANKQARRSRRQKRSTPVSMDEFFELFFAI